MGLDLFLHFLFILPSLSFLTAIFSLPPNLTLITLVTVSFDIIFMFFGFLIIDLNKIRELFFGLVFHDIIRGNPNQ